MALKDWKKIDERSDMTRFYKKGKPEMRLDYKPQFSKPYILYYKEGTKRFKTKSRALKFVKSYMRKH